MRRDNLFARIRQSRRMTEARAGSKRVASPASVPSAPASTTTVAPFRAWRGLQSSVARRQRGPPWIAVETTSQTLLPTSKLAEREGFEPSIRGLAVYTLSRRAPSTTRTSLRDAEPAETGPQRVSDIAPSDKHDRDWCATLLPADRLCSNPGKAGHGSKTT